MAHERSKSFQRYKNRNGRALILCVKKKFFPLGFSEENEVMRLEQSILNIKWPLLGLYNPTFTKQGCIS